MRVETEQLGVGLTRLFMTDSDIPVPSMLARQVSMRARKITIVAIWRRRETEKERGEHQHNDEDRLMCRRAYDSRQAEEQKGHDVEKARMQREHARMSGMGVGGRRGRSHVKAGPAKAHLSRFARNNTSESL